MKVFNAGWYLIYTKPRHEKKVHAYLSGRNINSFLPTARKLRMWYHRKKIIDEPLFPSYVFIYLMGEAASLLNYKPSTDLLAGLNSLYDWYQKNNSLTNLGTFK